MRVKRTQDFERAKTPEQKLWYAAGIPSRWWGEIEPPTFSNLIRKDQFAISTKEQNHWCSQLQLLPTWRKAHLVVIGSEPTDTKSCLLLARIAKQVVLHNKYIQMQDMGWAESHQDQNNLVYFGYNISSNTPPDRAQRIRDWIFAHDSRLRVLAVGGNPLELMFDVLHIKPDAVLYISDLKNTTFSLG